MCLVGDYSNFKEFDDKYKFSLITDRIFFQGSVTPPSRRPAFKSIFLVLLINKWVPVKQFKKFALLDFRSSDNFHSKWFWIFIYYRQNLWMNVWQKVHCFILLFKLKLVNENKIIPYEYWVWELVYDDYSQLWIMINEW